MGLAGSFCKTDLIGRHRVPGHLTQHSSDGTMYSGQYVLWNTKTQTMCIIIVMHSMRNVPGTSHANVICLFLPATFGTHLWMDQRDFVASYLYDSEATAKTTNTRQRDDSKIHLNIVDPNYDRTTQNLLSTNVGYLRHLASKVPIRSLISRRREPAVPLMKTHTRPLEGISRVCLVFTRGGRIGQCLICQWI